MKTIFRSTKYKESCPQKVTFHRWGVCDWVLEPRRRSVLQTIHRSFYNAFLPPWLPVRYCHWQQYTRLNPCTEPRRIVRGPTTTSQSLCTADAKEDIGSTNVCGGHSEKRTTVWQPAARAVAKVMTKRAWWFSRLECVGDEIFRWKKWNVFSTYISILSSTLTQVCVFWHLQSTPSVGSNRRVGTSFLFHGVKESSVTTPSSTTKRYWNM